MPVNFFKWKHYEGEIILLNVRWYLKYPVINELKNDEILPKNVGLWQVKYLNNIIEQGHRSIKRIIASMLGFQSFRSASKTSKGIEIMHISYPKTNFVPKLFKNDVGE
jgi:transposase-like protein